MDRLICRTLDMASWTSVFQKCAGMWRSSSCGKQRSVGGGDRSAYRFASLGIGLTVLLAERCSTNYSHRPKLAALASRTHKRHLAVRVPICTVRNNIPALLHTHSVVRTVLNGDVYYTRYA
ncbi:unnamed protein product, partial [Iphiclides podalirius]